MTPRIIYSAELRFFKISFNSWIFWHSKLEKTFKFWAASYKKHLKNWEKVSRSYICPLNEHIKNIYNMNMY